MKPPRQKGYKGTWPGGIIYVDSKGRECFTILRQIDGRRYKISTRAHSLKAAMAHLERFETDPSNYRPGGDPSGAVVFDEALRAKFLKWSRDTKRNTPDWVRRQEQFLAWWSEQLGEVDLRKVTLTRDILPPLETATRQRHRIAVLKAFYAWLREIEHTIKPAEDPTLDSLKVPGSQPEQARRVKAFSKEAYEKVRDWLLADSELECFGHAAIVLAGTGWHVAELVRFAEGGDVAENGEGPVLDLPRTKAGTPFKTRVSPKVAESARKLLGSGITYHDVWKYVRKAAKACGAPVSAGSFRHAVSTWAIDAAGEHPAVVSAFLNHTSPSTTKKFYATHAAPAKVKTME